MVNDTNETPRRKNDAAPAAEPFDPARFDELLGDDEPALKLVPDPDAQAGLGNLGAAVIEGDTAYFSQDALHAKSPPERGVAWVDSMDQVPDPKPYWVAWITLGRNPDGNRAFRGLVTCEMWIDREAMKGYKSLGDHVNAMRSALAGAVRVEKLTDEALHALRRLLSWETELWENASPELREALTAPEKANGEE